MNEHQTALDLILPKFSMGEMLFVFMKRFMKRYLTLVGSILAGVVLVQQNQDIREKAANDSQVWRCRKAKNARECADTCSLPKGKDDTMYQCRWKKSGECGETSKPCGARVTANTCPGGVTDCIPDTATKPFGAVTCLDKSDDE